VHHPRALLPGSPAREVLPELVRRPWQKLVREVHGLGEHPRDAELHRVRIRAKRARYAAEAAAPVVPDAGRHAKAIAALQGELGDHHDAVVAGAWLREVAPGLPASAALVAGMLVAAERAEAAQRRRSWVDAWEKASAPKRRKWL